MIAKLTYTNDKNRILIIYDTVSEPDAFTYAYKYNDNTVDYGNILNKAQNTLPDTLLTT